MEKIIVICGPTASGKSDLAVKIAKKEHGAILSVDSRQVYKGGSLASGKVPLKKKNGSLYYKDIEHFGIDIVDIKRTYSASQFQKYADKVIKQIIKSGKTPILCGGTGMWIDAIVYGTKFPDVKPNAKLRKLLGELSTEELYKKLKKLDPSRASTIDQKNPHRLIRAIEIAMVLGKVPEIKDRTPRFDVTWVVTGKPTQEKIMKRLKQRLKAGMVKEIKKLHTTGVSYKRLEAMGLEYKYVALYLQKKLTEKEMLKQLHKAIADYSKRQVTWFKKYAI